MSFKDEPKQQKGTGHVTKIDGDGRVLSETWLQTDRHETRPNDLADNVLNALTWVAVSALVIHITRLVVTVAVISGVPGWMATLVALAPYAIAGVGLLTTTDGKRFFYLMTLIFVALLVVTL